MNKGTKNENGGLRINLDENDVMYLRTGSLEIKITLVHKGGRRAHLLVNAPKEVSVSRNTMRVQLDC